MAAYDDHDKGGPRLHRHGGRDECGPPRRDELPPGIQEFPPDGDPDHKRSAFLFLAGKIAVETDELAVAARVLDHRGVCVDIDDTRPVDHLGVTVLTVSGDTPVPLLVRALRQIGVRADPVHVHTLSSHILLSPATFPVPANPPEGEGSPGQEATGTAVRVAVLDSGAASSPFLSAYLDPASDDDPILAPGGSLLRSVGHGTFVTGCIVQRLSSAGGLARPVTIYAKRVVDNTTGAVDDVALGIAIAALGAQADVLCLPLGGYSMEDQTSQVLDNALASAYRANPDLVVVAAAGNQALERPFWPASFKPVIGVGAYTVDGTGAMVPACFTNFGQWVDCCADGVNATSTFVSFAGPLDPEWAKNVDPGGCHFDTYTPGRVMDFTAGWAQWTGTSFAAPVVAGAIAAAIANGTAAHSAVSNLINDPSKPRIPGIGTVVH